MSNFTYKGCTFNNYIEETEAVILSQLEGICPIVEPNISIEGLWQKHDDYFPRMELVCIGYDDMWGEQKNRVRTITWTVTGYIVKSTTERKDLTEFMMKTQLAIEEINGLHVEGSINIKHFTGVNDSFNGVIDTYSDDKLRFFHLFFSTFYEL